MIPWKNVTEVFDKCFDSRNWTPWCSGNLPWAIGLWWPQKHVIIGDRVTWGFLNVYLYEQPVRWVQSVLSCGFFASVRPNMIFVMNNSLSMIPFVHFKTFYIPFNVCHNVFRLFLKWSHRALYQFDYYFQECPVNCRLRSFGDTVMACCCMRRHAVFTRDHMNTKRIQGPDSI